MSYLKEIEETPTTMTVEVMGDEKPFGYHNGEQIKLKRGSVGTDVVEGQIFAGKRYPLAGDLELVQVFGGYRSEQLMNASGEVYQIDDFDVLGMLGKTHLKAWRDDRNGGNKVYRPQIARVTELF